MSPNESRKMQILQQVLILDHHSSTVLMNVFLIVSTKFRIFIRL